MKLFIMFILVLTVAGISGLFIFKKPNGQAWLTLTDIKQKVKIPEELSILSNKIQSSTRELLNTVEDAPEIYKWQDEQGNWHYSDKNNNENSTAWTKPNNLTVIPPIKPLDIQNKTSNSEPLITSPDKKSNKSNKVTELLGDVNNIQHLMDERTKTIDSKIK